MRNSIVLSIIFIFSSSVAAENILLQKEQAKGMLVQCSRDTPEYEGSWQPSGEEIKDLENNLFKISTLVTKSCCGHGRIEGEIKDYTLQYVGIIIKGDKYIYINALAGIYPVSMHSPDIICDGGKSFWGAVYDPVSKTFSRLSFNGQI